MTACGSEDPDSNTTTWYQDANEDGLGNPSEIKAACDQPSEYVSNSNDDDDTGASINTLHIAFSEFDTSSFYNIFIEGDEVVLEIDGLPNHTSPYWSNITARRINGPIGAHTTEATATDHPLFVAPTVTTFDMMAPGNIDDFNGSYTLRLPINPEVASSSSSTGLGSIGFAVSGSMIYKDEEGPNVPLDNAVGSLDFTAAHTGPQSYHYHLETKAWSENDDKLIGIIADGFFLYGRKCSSTGTYPTDLDESGGHMSTTPHSEEVEYHYHIQYEVFLDQY